MHGDWNMALISHAGTHLRCVRLCSRQMRRNQHSPLPPNMHSHGSLALQPCAFALQTQSLGVSPDGILHAAHIPCQRWAARKTWGGVSQSGTNAAIVALRLNSPAGG